MKKSVQAMVSRGRMALADWPTLAPGYMSYIRCKRPKLRFNIFYVRHNNPNMH